jgi:predicted regulator of Ras-like GTPase activity (Roadblock/LC7/MglB family)
MEIKDLTELGSLVGTELVIVSKVVSGVPTAYSVPASVFGAGAGVTFASAAEIETGTEAAKALNPLQFKTWLTTFFTSGAIGNTKIVETNGSGLLIGATKATAYNKAFGTYTDIATGTSEVLVVNPKSVKDWWDNTITGATLGNSEVVETNGSGKLITVAKATGYNKAFGNASEINTGTETAKVVSPATVKSWWSTYIAGALSNSQVVETNGSGLLTTAAKATAYNKAFGLYTDITTGTSEVLVVNPKAVKTWWTTDILSGTFNVSSIVLTDGSGKLTTSTVNSAHNKVFSTTGNIDDSGNVTSVVNPSGLHYFYSGVTFSNAGTGAIALYKSKSARSISFYNININDTRLGVSLVSNDYNLVLNTSAKFATFAGEVNTSVFSTTPTAAYPAAGFQYDTFSKRFSLRGSITATDTIAVGTTLFTLASGYRPNTDVYCMISKFDTGMITHTMIPVKITATTGVVTNLVAIADTDKVFLDTFTFVLDNDLV